MCARLSAGPANLNEQVRARDRARDLWTDRERVNLACTDIKLGINGESIETRDKSCGNWRTRHDGSDGILVAFFRSSVLPMGSTGKASIGSIGSTYTGASWRHGVMPSWRHDLVASSIDHRHRPQACAKSPGANET